MAYIRKFRGRRRFNRRKPRVYRRNRRFGRKRFVTNKRWPPLGLTHSCDLTYTATCSINPSAGVSGDQVFRASDLYDPDVTGAGHQPYGFDQLMAMYNHFCVTGSKIEMYFTGGQSGTYYGAIALRADATSMGGQTAEQLFEQPRINFRMVYQGGDYQLSRGNRLTHKFSSRKFFRTRDPVGDEQYNGSAAASPAENAYYHCLLVPLGAEDMAGQSCFFKITYHAVFSEPKVLSQS